MYSVRVPPFAAMNSGVLADLKAPGDENGNHLDIAEVAVCQSNNGHLTGLWFLGNRPTGSILMSECQAHTHVFHHFA